MDPLTHTMVGAAIAGSGPQRYTRLAATTLVLAANAPDIDIVAQLGGPYTALAWRRGITHGLPALFILPLVVTGVVMWIDRLVRRRRPGAAALRASRILPLAFAGVLTHPALDWLNTYGMRWLTPLDDRWSYGDALFIIDPWLWLGLGGTLFVLHSRRPSRLVAWAAVAAGMSYLVLFFPLVPLAGKALWILGVLGFALVRFRRFPASGEVGPESGVRGREKLARLALAAAGLYILAMIGLDLGARREVREALAAEGVGRVDDLMVGPAPANPLRGEIVAVTGSRYLLGSFHWLSSPRARFHGSIPILPWTPELEAAAGTDDARNFLVWSRFPYFEIEEAPDGLVVRIGDARYAGRAGAGSLAGVTIPLDLEHRPR